MAPTQECLPYALRGRFVCDTVKVIGNILWLRHLADGLSDATTYRTEVCHALVSIGLANNLGAWQLNIYYDDGETQQS